MKRIILSFPILSMVLCFSPAQSLAEAQPRLITVTGSAERAQEPDLARIHINLWAKADSAKAAQSLANEEQEHFKKVIASFELKKQDLVTTGYEITPEYRWDEKNQTNKIIGYTAGQSIRVTLKKIEQVGKFLDALIKDDKSVKSGLTVLGVAWDLEKRDEMEKNLLGDAVKNAEEMAELLARASRVKIKGLHHLTPQSFGGPMPMFDSAPMMMKGGVARETSVYSGEIKVKAQVSAEYEIE